MGTPYWVYRVYYELKKKTILKVFQKSYSKKVAVVKKQWTDASDSFFLNPEEIKQDIHVDEHKLKETTEHILNGRIKYFHGEEWDTNSSEPWLTNPGTKYVYPRKHWSQISDFSAGEDIKYVWEKARFCYLYPVVRYDKYFQQDHSAFVFSEILSWIDHAPAEHGPHYVSSQEIALRILNWIFFLHFYKNSAQLTEEVFQKIMHAICVQTQHIADNLNFSKFLVRNNHIITEAVALFTVGVVFPFLPKAAAWKKTGKTIFEKEIQYQIYTDGSYLQYSMNYHRVIIQLLTWTLRLYQKNNIPIPEHLRKKSISTLHFLYACMNKTNGHLPNYGANDGSLFFPLNDNQYRDFRPQLQALSVTLGLDIFFDAVYEDISWFGLRVQSHSTQHSAVTETFSFTDGGYYVFKEKNTQTFIRCGNHTHRPSQADNLHIDIWCGNENILRDAGTYQYNCEKPLSDYYFGSRSHNTISINEYDQMLRGKRFIWFYWSRCKHAEIKENAEAFFFKGSIQAFRQTGNWILHARDVMKKKNTEHWEITDSVKKPESMSMTQIWNPSEMFFTHFEICAYDAAGNSIQPEYTNGFYSETYGVKQETKQILFHTNGNTIKTIIKRIQ